MNWRELMRFACWIPLCISLGACTPKASEPPRSAGNAPDATGAGQPTVGPTSSQNPATPAPASTNAPAAPGSGEQVTVSPTPEPPPGKVEPTTGQWSLQEKEYWAKVQEEMQQWVDSVSQGCSSKIDGAFAAPTFKGKFTAGGSYGLTGYARANCQAPFSAVRDLCVTGEMQRKAIVGGVKKIVCTHGAPNKSAVDLTAGTLNVTIDPETKSAATLQSEITDYLKKKL